MYSLDEILNQTKFSDYLVVIPCFQCANQVERLINDFANDSRCSQLDLLFIDNNSQDDTAARIQAQINKFKSSLNAKLIINHENIGLGGSFKKGVLFSRKLNYKGVFFLHGDNQAPVSDLFQMFEKVKNLAKPCVLWGNRFSVRSNLENYSYKREFANRMLSVLFTIILRKKVYDIGSGLNYFDLSLLTNELTEALPNHIAFDVRLLVQFVHNNEFHFFPIRWRSKDETSTVGNIEAAALVLRTLFQSIFFNIFNVK